MWTARERAKERRNLRLEFLEERNLLSVVTPHAVAAEVATTTKITTILTHVQGLPAAAGLYTQTLPGYQSYSGHGSSSQIGRVLFSAQQVETTTGTTVAITNGNGQMYDYKGDELFIAYSGTATTAAHKLTTISLTGTVTSGTRRFLNETGTFTATGTINPATGRLILTEIIVLNTPA